MPKRKGKQKFAKLGEKDCWHLYGLQVLTPTKFTRVVEKILQGRYALISSRLEERAQ
ncbi:MAG: hypothetical protein KAU35_03065 [candidate division Zixibacteria bacterium]|nr:hypothetical protein [candidate division Zixibacteria bacterium]